MRRNYGARSGKSSADFSAGIAVGYLCRNLEAELNDVAAKTGGRITALSLAAGVGNLLLAKARGQVLDGSEYLPQVRRNSSRRYEKSASEAEVHVRPRRRATLKRKAGPVTCTLCGKRSANRSKYMKHMHRDHLETVGKRSKSSGIRNYWHSMTPAQRSAEMKRRVAVREQKAA